MGPRATGDSRTSSFLRTRLRLGAVVAAAFLASFAVSAYASQSVWLNWVSTNANQTQQWTGHHLNYVEAEPEYYSWACANAQINGSEYFGSWYCSAPGNGNQSAYMYGTYLFAQAWNDSGSTQPIWAWAGYQ